MSIHKSIVEDMVDNSSGKPVSASLRGIMTYMPITTKVKCFSIHLPIWNELLF